MKNEVPFTHIHVLRILEQEQQIQCHPLLLVINVRKLPLLGMSLRLVQSGHFGIKPLARNPSRQED